MTGIRIACLTAIAACLAVLPAVAARAEIVLSELIVDLQPGKHVRDDIEVWNNSPDRTYVAVEPREILNPSLPSQSARQDPDPEKLGLLVAPGRMILEPGQRKLVRVATLGDGSDREHVYRVTIKPVVGSIQAKDSGLKLLVGYDVLVLVRPVQARPKVTASRVGRQLTFANSGNVSVEIVDGRQCTGNHEQCSDLPGKRLYPGASWTVELAPDRVADYVLKSPLGSEHKSY